MKVLFKVAIFTLLATAGIVFLVNDIMLSLEMQSFSDFQYLRLKPQASMMLRALLSATLSFGAGIVVGYLLRAGYFRGEK